VIPVLSRAQMRAFDAHASGARKVSSLVLMENAGRGAADIIERELLGGRARDAVVVVVCGTGNNGGDGFVVARHLALRGARVETWLVGSRDKTKGDARANLDALAGIGGVVREIDRDVQPLRDALSCEEGAPRIVVDALFGTGLDRHLEGAHVEVVTTMNEAPASKVALDVPSGLDADTGVPLGVAVRADLTVTFAHHKLGLLTPGGAHYAGRVVVADIGVPSSLSSEIVASAELLEANDVARLLGPRAADAHKTSAGHLGVLAGSTGKVGAALIVARAALRTGAGVVTIATWTDAARALDARVLEVMTARLDASALTASIDAALAGKRAAVIGPGFGLDDDAKRAVAHVLGSFAGPLVVDADALTLFAGVPSTFASSHAVILTPHPGEAGRLLGITAADVERDRFRAARDLSAASRAIVVLKGARTIVATPDGRVVINPTGNAALATAGSGDALAGIIGALACALDPFDAACAGIFIHGAAGDAWAAAHTDRGLLASEIADGVPEVLASLRHAGR
jgi:hydroxyethylthiazole kinase-like uncharacterized protein yjeF